MKSRHKMVASRVGEISMNYRGQDGEEWDRCLERAKRLLIFVKGTMPSVRAGNIHEIACWVAYILGIRIEFYWNILAWES